ncbi:Defensin-like protein [Linum perenne]
MEKTSFLGGLLLVLILLHPSQVMMGEAGAERRCEYESKRFKGPTCEVDENCAEVCKLEGFPGEVTMGEAGSVRRCEYESKRFKGTTCDVDANCAEVCKLEGFPGGDCQGYRTGCYCTKPC